MITEIDAAAERGALFLDMKNPQWFQHIDLRTLALISQSRCVLGQLYGSFTKGLSVLQLISRACELGFSTSLGHYTELNEAWRKEIRARRTEAKAA